MSATRCAVLNLGWGGALLGLGEDLRGVERPLPLR